MSYYGKLELSVGGFGARLLYTICPVCGHIQIKINARKQSAPRAHWDLDFMYTAPCSCLADSINQFKWTRECSVILSNQYAYTWAERFSVKNIIDNNSQSKKYVCYTQTCGEDDSISVKKKYSKVNISTSDKKSFDQFRFVCCDFEENGAIVTGSERNVLSEEDFEKVSSDYMDSDTRDAMLSFLLNTSISYEETETFEFTYRYAPELLDIKYNGLPMQSPYKESFLKRVFAYVNIDYPTRSSIWDVCRLADVYSLNTAVKTLKSHPFLVSLHSTYKSMSLVENMKIAYTGEEPLLDVKKTKLHEAFKVNKNVMRFLISQSSKICVDRGLVLRCQQMNTAFGPQVTENILNTLLEVADSYGNGQREMILDIKLKYKDCIDIKRLLEYLKTDIDIYQGITSPYEGLRLLFDYYSICEKMHIKPAEWLPRSLKLVHDIAAKNLKIITSKEQEEKLVTYVSSPEYLKFVMHGKEWSIIAPTCSKDIIAEGSKQSHCVGSYVGSVTERERMIFFMRRTEDLDTPVLTLDVSDGKLNQCKASCNNPATEAQMVFVSAWAKKNHLAISKYL